MQCTSYPYGLFVCTAVRGDKMNGCITNTAVQVVYEPTFMTVLSDDIEKLNSKCRVIIPCGVSLKKLLDWN